MKKKSTKEEIEEVEETLNVFCNVQNCNGAPDDAFPVV